MTDDRTASGLRAFPRLVWLSCGTGQTGDLKVADRPAGRLLQDDYLVGKSSQCGMFGSSWM